jgi:hypothetical protein
MHTSPHSAESLSRAAPIRLRQPGVGRALFILITPVLALLGGLVLLTVVEHFSQPTALLPAHRAAVAKVLAARGLTAPRALSLSPTGFVTAEYALDEADVRQLRVPLQEFAEQRLFAIREGLRPFGFKDFDVRVDGGSPSARLVTRYGAASITESGPVKWMTP